MPVSFGNSPAFGGILRLSPEPQKVKKDLIRFIRPILQVKPSLGLSPSGRSQDESVNNSVEVTANCLKSQSPSQFLKEAFISFGWLHVFLGSQLL